MMLKQLRHIGLTEGEIKVYEAILSLGECTKTALAKRSGISPSNIYDVTNRLIEKGIVSKTEKNGVLHFSPAHPEHLLDFLGQKKEEIKKEEELVHSLLPTLIEQFKEIKETTQVQVFNGWKGLQTVFEDAIRDSSPQDEHCVFGASIGSVPSRADTFFLKHSRIRARKGIRTKIIFNEEVRNRPQRIEYYSQSPEHHVRFLKQTTNTEVMTYKHTTNIIILTQEPLVIRVQSKEVTDSFIEHFKLLWEQAKE
jgi:sugar-specific transcriptional regulator TrmB